MRFRRFRFQSISVYFVIRYEHSVSSHLTLYIYFCLKRIKIKVTLAVMNKYRSDNRCVFFVYSYEKEIQTCHYLFMLKIMAACFYQIFRFKLRYRVLQEQLSSNMAQRRHLFRASNYINT